jgi:2-keto-3-deoxy-L-rhamnonate aldolase RhmA
MTDPADRLRQRLAADTPTFLMALRCWGSVEAVQVAAATGHHGIYVDLQHGPLALADASNLCLAATALGLVALVRLPAVDNALIGRMLDNGAAGLMLPDVEDEATAHRAVSAALHPPRGRRSLGGPRGFTPVVTPFLVPMIESPAGVVAAEGIAAISGIDALMVGSADLAASLGETPAGPGTHRATGQVIAAGRAIGCPVIVAGLRDPSACQAFVDQGATRCHILGTDIGYLLDGARRQVNRFRAMSGGQVVPSV